MPCWHYSQFLTCLVVCIVCHWLTGQPRVRQTSILRLTLSSLWAQSQPFELWNLNLLTVCPHKSYILLIHVSETQFKTPHNSQMDYIVFVNTLDSENVINHSTIHYNRLSFVVELCTRWPLQLELERNSSVALEIRGSAYIFLRFDETSSLIISIQDHTMQLPSLRTFRNNLWPKHSTAIQSMDRFYNQKRNMMWQQI